MERRGGWQPDVQAKLRKAGINCITQRERCDCNTGCLRATGNLNEETHECQVKISICSDQYVSTEALPFCACVSFCAKKGGKANHV